MKRWIRPGGLLARTTRLFAGAGLLALCAMVVAAAEPALAPAQWENAIRAFEEQDEAAKPAEGGIVFVGSSSIRLWDVKQSFPGLPVINRGFGGSQIADSVRYTDRIVIPYNPRTIVFYAGDNDIAAGKSPEQVFADFAAFSQKVRSALPDARIMFISIKPSLARWALIEKIRKSNALIRDFCASAKGLVYLDVEKAMLGTDGKPKPELFVADGLHMTPEGYKIWASLLQPFLAAPQAGRGATKKP